jgi:hypothetical protein
MRKKSAMGTGRLLRPKSPSKATKLFRKSRLLIIGKLKILLSSDEEGVMEMETVQKRYSPIGGLGRGLDDLFTIEDEVVLLSVFGVLEVFFISSFYICFKKQNNNFS